MAGVWYVTHGRCMRTHGIISPSIDLPRLMCPCSSTFRRTHYHQSLMVPFRRCSFFEYRSCQQEVKQVRQARGGKTSGHRHPSTKHMKALYPRRRCGPETGCGVRCDSVSSPHLLPIDSEGKYCAYISTMQAHCLFSRSAGYGRWWV